MRLRVHTCVCVSVHVCAGDAARTAQARGSRGCPEPHGDGAPAWGLTGRHPGSLGGDSPRVFSEALSHPGGKVALESKAGGQTSGGPEGPAGVRAVA